MKLTIIRDGVSTSLTYPNPALLSTILTDLGIPFDMPCGGRQRCLKCKMTVKGDLSPLSAREKELLSPEEQNQGVRFACMTTVQGDTEVTLPSKKGKDKILISGLMPEFVKKPWAGGWGIAVDIGTTTVAAYLYNLQDCELTATASEKNPQGSFGADVISRIEKSLAGEAGGLAQAITGCLNRLVAALCRQAGIQVQEITAMVIAGNTAMEYLLCGRSPASIAAAPFEQDCFFGEWITPKNLGISLQDGAKIYITRCIAAYVGGDITAAILASQLEKARETALLVDIGTNGEMVLAAGGKLLSCSTAAGPAFEGAAIYMGSNAADGAISSLTLEPDGTVLVKTIHDKPAKSICGSGIVDAVAMMIQTGVLDETGLILEEDHAYTSYITQVDGNPAFQIPGTPVIITQNDIRSIQLAKSAICSGMLTLIHEAGILPQDVKTLYIAGGFGNFISARSAEAIGLIPFGFADKAKVIGNAAGTGASMMLLSDAMLDLSEQVAQKTAAVELSTSPFFMDTYIECMMFQTEA